VDASLSGAGGFSAIQLNHWGAIQSMQLDFGDLDIGTVANGRGDSHYHLANEIPKVQGRFTIFQLFQPPPNNMRRHAQMRALSGLPVTSQTSNMQ
jgi:hypothetical protein